MDGKKFFEEILAISGQVDQKIESLEFKVSKTIGDCLTVSGTYDISEELLQEVEEKAKFAEDALTAIQQDLVIEDSFIQKAFEDARWLDESVSQIEQFAQQYGYVPKQRVKVDEAYEQYLEEKTQGSDNDGTVNSNQAPAFSVDSPNLITCGLSKSTLGNLGFQFKEGTFQEPSKISKKPGSVAPISEAERFNATNASALESPFLISKRPLKQIIVPEENSFSDVEISPGLVLRRPSSRSTSSQTKTATRPTGEDNSDNAFSSQSRESTVEATQQEKGLRLDKPNRTENGQCGHSKDDLSPQMPVLTTINVQKILNMVNSDHQKSVDSQKSEDSQMKSDHFSALLKEKDDSPKTPSYATININNLTSFKTESAFSSRSEFKKSECAVPLNFPPTDTRQKETDSPEFPSLNTININRLRDSQYHPSKGKGYQDYGSYEKENNF